MASAERAYRRLAQHWLKRLSGPQSRETLADLRPGLPNLSNVLDWACSGHDFLLAQELFGQAEELFELEGLGEKACVWTDAILTAARAGTNGLSVFSALRRHARALRSRAGLRTNPGGDLVSAFNAYNEAYQRADTPTLEALTLGERGVVLSDLAAVAGENRALRLQQALDDYNSAQLRTEAGSGSYFVLRNNLITLLPQLASLPGQDRTALLRQALTIAEPLLAHFQDDPDLYATFQLNRASLLRELSQEVSWPERGSLLRQALEATEEALSREGNPLVRGKALVARAGSLISLAAFPGEDRSARLQEALAAHDQALAALRDSPLDYATAQNNRSGVLLELARFNEDPGERIEYLQQALVALDEAEALRRSTSHEKAGTLFNRAVVLELLAREQGPWPKAERLREALASALGALATAEVAQHAFRRDAALQLLRRLRGEILVSEGTEGFDRWWSELTDQSQPAWSAETTALVSFDQNDEILRAYLFSRSSEERRHLLRTHSRELLAEGTLDLLERIAREVDGEELRASLERMLGFLRRCRELGVEAALAEADAEELPPLPHLAAALEAMRNMSPQERISYLADQPELREELARGRYIIEVGDDPYSSIRDEPGLLQGFLEFFNAGDWGEARRIFDPRADAFLRNRDALLQLCGQTGPDNEPLQQRIRMYGRLLRRCAEIGADAAFAEVVTHAGAATASRSRFLELLAAEDFSTVFRILAEAPPEFFFEVTFEVLADLARSNSGKGAREQIEFLRTLLRRVQVEGLRPAFAATLTQSFCGAGKEGQAMLLTVAQQTLTLNEIDSAFDPLLKANAGRPDVLPRLQAARRLLRRAWDVGFAAAQAELESRQSRAAGVYSLLMELMDLRGDEQPRLVAEHREALLDPRTLDALEEMVSDTPPSPPSAGGEDSVRSFRSLLRLLRRCAEIGIEEAFDEKWQVIGTVLALVQAPSREERLAVARENASVLLEEEADLVLYDLGQQFAAEPARARRISRWREALQRAREEGLELMVEKAHADEEREARLREGISALLAADDADGERRVVDEYADVLLTEEAEDAIVRWLRQMQADPDYAAMREEIGETISRYRDLLQRCRAHGIEAAFLQIEEGRRREEVIVDELADEIGRLEEKLTAYPLSVRVRLAGERPLLVYRVRQLLRPRGSSGPATLEEEIRAAVLPALWELFQAAQVNLKRDLVERYHDLLLSEEADQLLGLIQEREADTPLEHLATLHRQLLRRCREAGIPRAFAELAAAMEEGATE
jgi:hypothetical protein